MSLLQDAFVKTLVALRAIPPPQPVTWEHVFGSRESASTGIHITEESALRSSPVWAGVSTLSRDIAKLPLVLYRNLSNGGKEPFKEHRLYRVLKDEPNPEMTSYKFRETMQALCLLYGNAYAEIVFNNSGQAAGMYPILPTRVTPIRDGVSGRLQYRIRNSNGGQTILPADRMIHLSSLSLDGVIGQSIVEHARESLALGLAAETFGATFFGNGTTFGGVVSYPMALSPEQRASIADAIDAVHQGVNRAHKNLILGGNATYTPRGTNPNEAQFLETRKFQINEVARWLTMPPHKLGDLENAHFTNIEEQEIQYYVGTVSGWLKMWEQELSRKLISPLEYSQQTIEHNLEGVLRGDSAKRSEFYTKMFQIGAFSINRILRLENQNPIGPEGDQHFVPLNMVPVERYKEMIDATIFDKLHAKQGTDKQILPATAEPDEAAARAAILKQEIRSALDDSVAHTTRAIEAEQQAATSREEAAALRAEVATEREAAQAALELAQAKQAELEQALAERDALEAQRSLEMSQRLEAEARATAADAARVAAEALAVERAEQVRAAAEQVAVAVAAADAAQADGRASDEARTAAEQAIAAAQEALQAREAELVEAADAATLQAALAGTDAAGLREQLQSQRDAEADRMAQVVAAHRGLIVDVMQRVLRPETDRARRRQATPESLRKWVEAFYQTHREVCTEALVPAVATHLAWQRSEADPRTVAATLAEAHCAESERQLRGVIDGAEPEEFHGVLERMLLRWEQERPQAVADKVLTDAIQYLRHL
jgi:HK97 family phage portal protein